MSWRWPVVTGLSLALAVWLGLALLLDRYGGRSVPEGPWDAIVVAGCRVTPEGKPSLALARRVRAAVALYEAGHADNIVFTGGVGTHPPAEAIAAAGYARTLGLPAEAAIVEVASTSTEENARFAAQVTDARRVLVVTDGYHVFRSERVFRRYFAVVRGVGSQPTTRVRFRGALREVGAVAVYWVQGRL